MNAETFEQALVTTERAAQINEADDLYGWLIGSWSLRVLYSRADVRAHDIDGEVHFVRVLQGFAVQDVWIMPSRATRLAIAEGARPATLLERVNTYGTTLRVWDAALGAWRVTWINPVRNTRDELLGRRVGSELVQDGTHGDGTPIRWMFSDITPDSFRWTGWARPDGLVMSDSGASSLTDGWTLEAEFHARRM